MIERPGLMSTIQDMGRWEHLSQGVPRSGVMDVLSARIANLAVGNEPDAAVIEFTYGDARLRTETDILIAYSGDGATLFVDSERLPSDRPIYLAAGSYITLVNNPAGCRTYLAIAGGWDVPEVLGSRSTYMPAAFGGFQGRALQAGDVLHAGSTLSGIARQLCHRLRTATSSYSSWGIARWRLLPSDRRLIRVIPAREFTWFEGKSVVDFLSSPYTVSPTCNRMGYHLNGAPIGRLFARELLSTAVMPGTIQVTGDGRLILLMADSQTTGGYPRIAQVAAVDMPLCGQLKPGDSVYFREISRMEAEKLYLQQERLLTRLAVAITTKLTAVFS